MSLLLLLASSRSTWGRWSRGEGESYHDAKTDEHRNEPNVGASEGVNVKSDKVNVNKSVRSKSANVETAKMRWIDALRCWFPVGFS